jgi:toxin YhaV
LPRARRLPPEQARQHPDVKLFAAVNNLLKVVIPADPDRPDFKLKDDLRRFRRVKGHGLPQRYRLCYCYSSKTHAIIVVSFYDDETLRKEGSATDPYAVFQRLIERGIVGADYTANWQIVERELREQEGLSHGRDHGHPPEDASSPRP